MSDVFFENADMEIHPSNSEIIASTDTIMDNQVHGADRTYGAQLFCSSIWSEF